jgi:hypothetical protein
LINKALEYRGPGGLGQQDQMAAGASGFLGIAQVPTPPFPVPSLDFPV